MSELLQTGQHPDADQLTAFVEHTLPPHEQQQTLAHLGICPACRQIVALSLPAAAESPSLQPAVRHRWFPRWNPAWAVIPALAALILVILFVRNGERRVRQTSVPAQIADASKPAAPPVASASPEIARNVAPSAQHPRQKRPIAAGTEPPALDDARQGLVSGSAVAGIGGVAGGIAIRPAQPLTPGRSFAASSASVGGPVSSLAVDRVQAVFSAPRPLPSYLAILSMATHGNQRIAIDTDNHLFFSDDEGRNWKAVHSPWKGRAVAVALTSHVSSGNEAPDLKMSSRPAVATGGTLSGTVTDPTGAVISGATVVATNSAAAIARSAVTDNYGHFRMGDLVPGSYRIEAQAKGFETQSFTAEVAPAQQAVADVTLRVGSAAESVTVEASPGLLASSPVNVELPQAPDIQTLSRFELTTDDGEHWMSADGQSWTRE